MACVPVLTAWPLSARQCQVRPPGTWPLSGDVLLAFAILAGAVLLFVTEWVRVDLVALMVLAAVALTGLVEPKAALSGFSNPAVVTVWAVFILSGGLSRTGVAGMVGRQVLRLAGDRELVLVALIMSVSAGLSAFMNNVGVAALLLPVVMDIARQTGRPPSKLLMPLAFSSLLGGLTTLIGTPPNLLVSEALRQGGLREFRLFDFTPLGLAVVVAGIGYMAFAGRRLLPARDPVQESAGGDLERIYGLGEELFVVRLPESSALDGHTLAKSKLGAALGLNVICVLREGGSEPAPSPATVLRAGDRLLVSGERGRLAELRGGHALALETGELEADQLVTAGIQIVEVELLAGCGMAGQTLSDLDFRHRFEGAIVLAVRRGGEVRRTALETLALETLALETGDLLLVQGTGAQIDAPANVLIMGPGGYRFIDYIKVGLPLTIVCLVTTLIVLPIFWPL